MGVGRDHGSEGIEGQGQRSRVTIRVRVADRFRHIFLEPIDLLPCTIATVYIMTTARRVLNVKVMVKVSFCRHCNNALTPIA